jgi:hypothetical protein
MIRKRFLKGRSDIKAKIKPEDKVIIKGKIYNRNKLSTSDKIALMMLLLKDEK